MAKPAWVTLSKTSGTGNGSVAISAAPHTGFKNRTGAVLITNASGTKPAKTINISQAAKALFVDVISKTPLTLPATGGMVAITFKSNAFTIGAMCETGGFQDTGSTCTVNSVAQTISALGQNGMCVVVPTGDPGASAEYTAIFNLKFYANTSAKAKSYVVKISVSDSEGDLIVDSPNFTVTVAAAASTLSVSPESISLVTAGTAQSVAVTSNDDWAVV